MGGCKSIGIVSILVLSSFFGIFALYGTDVAIGTTVSGHISVDTTWDLGGSPYIVMENVIVDPGITLTIDPGVEVKFDPPGTHDYLSIYVEGALISIGDPNLSIEFTSNRPIPQIWDWRAIQINSSGHADVMFSEITYANLGIRIFSSNNTVKDNFISSGNVGVSLEPSSSRNHVGNNTAHDMGAFVWADSSSHNVIENNTILNSSSAVAMYGSSNSLLRANVIEDTLFAIELHRNLGNNTVDGNTITNASLYGILLDSSPNSIVENNAVTKSRIGIQISSGIENSNLTIAHNSISGCKNGISAGYKANNNSYLNNRIVQNEKGIYVGFNVKFSSASIISQNEIISNSIYGLHLRNVSETLVYHNSFIDNAIQAFNDNGTNSWDYGYPTGGNYWSDYGGLDLRRGANQDEIGADGIGDSPYFINLSAVDRYPLAEPTTGNLPPRNVNAHLSGNNYENVTITWNLSWNDGRRANDVTGYGIYRSLNYDRERTGYQLIGSLPNNTTEFVDVYSGEGDPNNYFYYVCSVNGTGNRSCSVDQVGKFTRPLLKGQNLASVPLIQSDEDIASVLQTVAFEKAWFYDSFDQEWISCVKSKPYIGDFRRTNHTIGFWINVTEASNLTVAGIVPMGTSIPLFQGWNLIGYPSLVARQIQEYLAEVEWDEIESFDNGSFPYSLKRAFGGDDITPGASIWVHVSSDTILWVSDDM